MNQIDSDSDGEFTIKDVKDWVSLNKFVKEVEEDRYELPGETGKTEEEEEVEEVGEEPKEEDVESFTTEDGDDKKHK